MYQPKIREDLIPKLYRKAKLQGVPMTDLVTQLVEEGLARIEELEGEGEEMLAREK